MEDTKISVAEAAERLGVRKAVVYRLIHTGVLPAYRVHGMTKILVKPADVDKIGKASPVATVTPEDSVSLNRAANILHCRPTVVRELISRGEIRGMRTPSGRVRVPVDSLNSYMTGGADVLADDQAAS